MKPRSDLVLQIASTSDIAKTQAATFTGTLVELDRLSATTVRFAVEIPNRSELAFLPGQYVNITVPGTDQTRSYSFSNAPHEDRLTFLVKLTPGGADVGLPGPARGCRRHHHVHRTARVVLPARDRTPGALLAGGTGLAPILAMLRKMRADGSRRKVHLIYGVKHRRRRGGTRSARPRSAAALTGFTWDHCVSDPPPAPPTRAG